jgi:acetyl-CoA carboxylase biotin carboxyl carrier protein
MNIDEIKKIVELMEENDLAEFEMEKDGFRIAMRKSQPTVVAQQTVPAVAPQTDPDVQAGIPADKTSEEEEGKYETIISPMVGTFYAAPSPDSEPYVRVDDEIENETVVCILEAMKVMNEIKAEVHGRIADVLVENAEPVEFGQPLFKVELLS